MKCCAKNWKFAPNPQTHVHTDCNKSRTQCKCSLTSASAAANLTVRATSLALEVASFSSNAVNRAWSWGLYVYTNVHTYTVICKHAYLTTYVYTYKLRTYAHSKHDKPNVLRCVRTVCTYVHVASTGGAVYTADNSRLVQTLED